MHEFAVTNSILAIVLEKARESRAKKVTKIDLQVGRLTGFVPECIQLQFDILSRGTIAAGAGLSFHQPLVNLRCRRCDVAYTTDSFDLICPDCHNMDIEILSGSELYIESMEVE
jgi:hydrogenase nickel incorporation protein HypA/HybF